MKKLLLLALTAIMMVGCDDRTTAEIEEAERLNGFNVIIVDSCEYVSHGYWLAHKGNCKFCTERRKQELKELVEQLKDK
jgi:hypothetical protein